MEIFLSSAIVLFPAVSLMHLTEAKNVESNFASEQEVSPKRRVRRCVLPPVRKLFVLGAFSDVVMFKWLPPWDGSQFDYVIQWQVADGGCVQSYCEPSGELKWGRNLLRLDGVKPFTRMCVTVTPSMSLGGTKCPGSSTQLCARSLPEDNTIWSAQFDPTSLSIAWMKQNNVTEYTLDICTRRGVCSEVDFNDSDSCSRETVSSKSKWYVATDLQPWTSVLVKVRPYHTSGIQCFTTNVAEPTPPRDVQAVEVTNTTATISWKAPLKANGPLSRYGIAYSEDGKLDRVVVHPEEDEATTIRIENLRPGVAYTVEIIAVNHEVGRLTELWSKPVTIKIKTSP